MSSVTYIWKHTQEELVRLVVCNETFSLGLSQFVGNFCFLLLHQEITASFSPKILEKNLVGHVTMEDFTLALKWSKIGHIRLYLIQVRLLRTKFSTLNSA